MGAGTVDRRSAPGLRDRHSEREAFDRLLGDVRAGQSRVLVLHGEAGIGKTALLEYLQEVASGCHVARTAGVESEMELAFASLQQLCAPMVGRLEHLPGPQRDALGTAFGLRDGEAADRFLVGLAVLGLVSEVAEDRPLVCVVDDAQWLDRASSLTLAFVARRLQVDPVALVFALREPNQNEELAGLPELPLSGLDQADAGALLDWALPGRVDELVRDRIQAEARGNPLALLELPRGITPAELAGGYGLLEAQPVASRIEESFRRRLRALPGETQRLILLAAAEPIGDVTLLWRGAAGLGLGADASLPAERAGLIDLGARVRFRHPLVRSAAYRAATPSDRQDVHRALAEATDPRVDPDRRAWHRAQAAAGPDEAVAAELEASADRAGGRGGVAAAAAFLERATELTPDPARRAGRALAAAQAKFDAGAPDAALELLATAAIGPLEELQRALLMLLHGRIESERGRTDALRVLLEAARLLEPLDPCLAREAYLDALGAAMFRGRLGSSDRLRVAAEAARAAPPGSHPPRAVDLLVDGLATRFTQGYAAGVGPLRRALSASFRDSGSSRVEWPWPWVASELCDDEARHQVTSSAVRLTRESGALTRLLVALSNRAIMHVRAGEFLAASALIEEADSLAEVTGTAPLPYARLQLVAWRGQEAPALELIGATIEASTASGADAVIAWAQYAAALLYNSLGRYQDAFDIADRATRLYPGLFAPALVEQVEAAARSGAPDRAAAALGRLQEASTATGTEWALGSHARSRALLSRGQFAETLHREAIERLARTRDALYHARAYLVYGEWLRRENRRVDARQELRTAYDMLSRLGAEAFAERARAELQATGETVRKRSEATRYDLTPQEAQIGRLADEGLTNPEIGAQLFLSPRTVEWHLGKVFSKLGISSRRELHRALAAVEATPQA